MDQRQSMTALLGLLKALALWPAGARQPAQVPLRVLPEQNLILLRTRSRSVIHTSTILSDSPTTR